MKDPCPERYARNAGEGNCFLIDQGAITFLCGNDKTRPAVVYFQSVVSSFQHYHFLSS